MKRKLRIRQNVWVTNFADQSTAASSSSKGIKSNIEASGILLKLFCSDLSSSLNSSGDDVGEESSEAKLKLTDAGVLSLDSMLSVITTDSVIIFLNIASLSYQQHLYENCRQILEKLLEFFTVEPQDSGISLKVCFLLIEVILHQWNNSDGYHTEKESNYFQSQSLLVLIAAEKYLSLLQNDDENGFKEGLSTATSGISGLPDTIDLRDILGCILDYRIKLYHCRIDIAIGLYKEAQKNIDTAIIVYDKILRPIANDIDEAIVLTDVHNLKSSCRYFIPVSVRIYEHKDVFILIYLNMNIYVHIFV